MLWWYLIGRFIVIVSDVNECESPGGMCLEENEVCENIPGSYKCVCPPDYQRQGSGCQPLPKGMVSFYICRDYILKFTPIIQFWLPDLVKDNKYSLIYHNFNALFVRKHTSNRLTLCVTLAQRMSLYMKKLFWRLNLNLMAHWYPKE